MSGGERFPIRFSRPSLVVLGILGIWPRWAYVELEGDRVLVRMGWAFRAEGIARASIAEAGLRERVRGAGVGAHWMGKGRWVVNGSSRGLVTLRIDPPARAAVLGIPVNVRELWVSLEDPAAFLAAIDR